MSNSNENLLQEFYTLINTNNKMEYQWFQKLDDIKHTGIVIKFGLTQQYILEFGADESSLETKLKKAAAGASGYISSTRAMKFFLRVASLPGKSTLRVFSADGIQVMGSLVELPLTNQAEKEKAKSIFTHITNLDIGKYNVVTKNCRSYVVIIALYISSQVPEINNQTNMRNFGSEMNALMSEDQMKFEECKNFVKRYTSGKNRDQHQNEVNEVEM